MASAVAGGRITTALGASILSTQQSDRNPEATCFVGSIDLQVTEEILWELCVQVGPVVSVYMPKDRVTGEHQGYGFVEFKSAEDSSYAIKTLNMIKLYGKPIRVAPAQQAEKDAMDVGANIFVGNLDADVDETLLHTTFSAFGGMAKNPKVMRDPETGVSKGFGFVSFADFESSDQAIEVMDGQFLGGRPIQVNYAFKKDKSGTVKGQERHGTPAERLLAAQKKLHQGEAARPHTMFATGPKQAPQPGVELAAPPTVGPPQPMWGNPWTGGAPGFVPPPPPGGGLGIPPPPPVMSGDAGIPPPPSDDIPPPPPPPPS
jgi:splicing factor 3B subunit 4